MRAISLLSGGLDSILATKLILEQGVDVHALNFVSVFCTCTSKNSSCSAAQNAVRQLGTELTVLTKDQEYLDIVKNPAHGYGSQVNPCIDCRIFMFRKAHELMHKIEASFLITGEVLGERPMSQRRAAMKLIEREGGVEGLVVRPLSARLLEPSIPEAKGWVDRTRFLTMHGRGRRPQMDLARSFNIADYPCPAGGCRLTDPGFAMRMRDLMAYSPGFTLNDVKLLKVGRHFRMSPKMKAVVGRNEIENIKLTDLCYEEDLILSPASIAGPTTLIRGMVDESELLTVGRITAAYTKAPGSSAVEIAVTCGGANELSNFTVFPVDVTTLTKLMIGGKTHVARSQ